MQDPNPIFRVSPKFLRQLWWQSICGGLGMLWSWLCFLLLSLWMKPTIPIDELWGLACLQLKNHEPWLPPSPEEIRELTRFAVAPALAVFCGFFGGVMDVISWSCVRYEIQADSLCMCWRNWKRQIAWDLIQSVDERPHRNPILQSLRITQTGTGPILVRGLSSMSIFTDLLRGRLPRLASWNIRSARFDMTSPATHFAIGCLLLLPFTATWLAYYAAELHEKWIFLFWSIAILPVVFWLWFCRPLSQSHYCSKEVELLMAFLLLVISGGFTLAASKEATAPIRTAVSSWLGFSCCQDEIIQYARRDPKVSRFVRLHQEPMAPGPVYRTRYDYQLGPFPADLVLVAADFVIGNIRRLLVGTQIAVCYDSGAILPASFPRRRRDEFVCPLENPPMPIWTPLTNHRSSSRLLRRIVCALFALLVSLPLHAQDSKADKGNSAGTKPKVHVENPFPKAFPSPELEGGVEWLNTSAPLTLKELRGKIVLLDFWTFCCINCMHVLPDLKYLEKKYGNELVVIGVHTAKFKNEKETGNIREAILRYEIEHPVINDANMTLWRKFEIGSWPTLVLIDPEGRYCGRAPGEGNRELLDTKIGLLAAYHRSKGTLDETPVRFHLERNSAPPTPLRFPGKLVADETNSRLFISDSNHNRIVISSLDGKLIDVIGSGAIGAKDGSYADAQFDRPQGMTLVGDTLYVADTENHLLRTVDLVKKEVTTLAGTGKQGHYGDHGGNLLQTELNSPWDLCVVDDVLYIAMAGPHQIWSHKLGSGTIQSYAGSGREDITNGDLEDGALAQPSGIVSDGKYLYVVDSEGSAVRKISTKTKQNLSHPAGEITTIAGTHDLPGGASLFQFGDVDGDEKTARLQHPLGIALHNNGVFVADSYNHKIKYVDFKTRRVKTWLGASKPGNKLDPVQLAEPAGLAIADGKMYVADTNNHRILVVDIVKKATQELVIADLTPPKPAAEESERPHGREVALESHKLTAGDAIEFAVEFTLPDDFKLNSLMPVTYKVAADGEGELIPADHLNVRLEATSDGSSARFKIPVLKKTGSATLSIALSYGYCRDGKGGLCKIDTIRFKVPVELAADGDANPIALKAAPK